MPAVIEPPAAPTLPSPGAAPSPFVRLLGDRDGPEWRRDLPASITVFLVALPLCLGIALASGAPASAGLVAGIVGGLVVGVLSGSQLMVSGPAAGLTAIVLDAITRTGFPAFLAAVIIAGALQAVMGAIRAGVIAYYFPSSVIKGMLAAIGVILILKQLPHALGHDEDFEGDFAFHQANDDNTLSAALHAVQAIEPLALLTSLVGLALLFAWDRPALRPLRVIPAPLAVVLFGVGAEALAHLWRPDLALDASHHVALATDGGLGALFTAPDWGAFLSADVWRVAVTLAVVASLETLLSLEATDRLDPEKRRSPASRELVAQGVGNLTSGLLGGLPLTGVIVRSAANIAGGARTRWSGIVHGGWLLLAVSLVPGALNRIPLAALAAILLHTGYKLAKPALVAEQWRLGRHQFIPFAVTIAAILFTDLLVGIFVGLNVGAFFILLDHLRAPAWREVSPAGAVLRRLKLHDHVTFLNKAALAHLLDTLPPASRLELDGRDVQRIDRDALEVIHDYAEVAPSRGVDLRLVGIPPRAGGGAAH